MLTGTWMRAPKLASYGIIFSALLTQLAYAKVLVGEEEDPIDVASIDITKSDDSEDLQWSYIKLLMCIETIFMYIEDKNSLDCFDSCFWSAWMEIA